MPAETTSAKDTPSSEREMLYAPPPSVLAPTSATVPVRWKLDVNQRYQKVADLLISLSTGSLILPPLFLREYLGVNDEPLAMFLDSWAWLSVAGFGLTILLGIGFHYASAKWIKQAWGQKTVLSEASLERLLDGVFVAMITSFLAGVALFLVFVAGA